MTLTSTSRICASVIGALWAKSKRVRSASTSEPFCCTCCPSTSRKALCIRWVTLWLRIVRARRSASTRATKHVADPDHAFGDPALVAENGRLHLDRILDDDAGARIAQFAGIADLTAAFGVERRVVEHDDDIVAGSRLLDRRAVDIQRDDAGLLVDQLLIAMEVRRLAGCIRVRPPS